MDFERQRRELVERLKRELSLTPEIVSAFLAVPREEFVPQEYRNSAYADCALPLQEGATISQPSMLAIMLLEMDLEPQMDVLEVGSGSGYFLALLSQMGANVVGVEIIPELAERSKRTLQALGYSAMVIQGDAAKMTYDRLFDRVVFSAALRQIPQWSRDLLKPGGFVLAPVGEHEFQELVRGYKDADVRTGRYCRFVPFV